MSMKGEKRGFSGRMAHWMVCKVLKRKGYYVSSPVVRNAPVALDPGVLFPIEVQPTERVQDAKLLTPFPYSPSAADTASPLVLCRPRQRASSIKRSSTARLVAKLYRAVTRAGRTDFARFLPSALQDRRASLDRKDKNREDTLFLQVTLLPLVGGSTRSRQHQRNARAHMIKQCKGDWFNHV